MKMILQAAPSSEETLYAALAIIAILLIMVLSSYLFYKINGK
jgi:hypothetical protein